MSACAEIFLAGKERFITGIVGFHNLWYNFTIGTPSDPHKLIKWLTLEYNIINPFSTLPDNPQGLSGEFSMDVANAGGEFLIFTANDDLNLYSNSNCFDCVDESCFRLLPTDINETANLTNTRHPHSR